MIKQFGKIFSLFSMVSILSGCNLFSGASNPEDINPPKEEEKPEPIKTALENSEEYIDFFKYGSDIKINVKISNEALAFISNNQLSPYQYHYHQR